MRLLPMIPCAVLIGCVSSPAPERVPAAAPDPDQRLMAESLALDYRIGEQVRKGAWKLDAAAAPDVLTAWLQHGQREEVCLISGDNSLCRTVGVGDHFDFVISHQGVDYPTRIAGVFLAPMAMFDEAYQVAHRGLTRISIPEVYELVNVAIALTPRGREDRWLVIKDTPYYEKLMEHFAPMAEHPFVIALERDMQRDRFRYFRLKMNAYAFEYDGEGRIVRSPIYDRTGFPSDRVNELLPFLGQMQAFSDQSRFREFYAAHRPLYESQIAYYRDEINVAAMLQWLREQFPEVRPYDTTNIIFSPLVGGSQSLTWAESNGFRELQPHVNFPYPSKRDDDFSAEATALRRGYILFTELNHGFINPTADLYADAITSALDQREHWAVAGTSSDAYSSAYMIFTEMMNWALVSLYLVDKAPDAERATMIEALNPYMGAEGRGFPRFPQFNGFLVELYRNRAPGTRIADLYPAILDWFASENETARTPAVAEQPIENEGTKP